MSEEVKRVQVNMSRQLRDLLRDWAAEVSKERDEEVGTGTVAGLLLEEFTKRPDLVRALLFEPTTIIDGEVRREDGGKLKTHQSVSPKGKGSKDAAA